ncbi:MAG TPA: lysine--tRNA ligase [Thermoanaerobaculia bacterium]|nr:lysine--tRNA ligase [Thermoanaerobaculia bacterium]
MSDHNSSLPPTEVPESDLLAIRREKLDHIAQAGFERYPGRATTDTTIRKVVAGHGHKSNETLESESTEVAIAGRIMTLRDHGKTAFLDLSEGGARVQVYCRKDALTENEWILYENLDLGDWVAVQGVVFRTKKGELSVKAAKLDFLCKALRPLPEKWHGLTDVEQRYRQRYVDLIVNDDVKKVFEIRASIIRFIRRFFDTRDFIEVETPMMQPIAGGAAARPFVTHHNALDLELYLRIAPELYLKRLIVGGFPRVYEINRNFRNEGISTQHNPEFTMLEFYQAYADYRDLMTLSEELLSALVREVKDSDEVVWKEQTIRFTTPFARYTMKEAIAHFSSHRGEAIATEVLEDRAQLLRLIRERSPQGAKLKEESALTDGHLVAQLFELIVEEHLIDPTFITDFPVEISPLSKQRPDDPRYVDRFELYAGGMEIANAFSELNDPDEQARRFRMQIEQRESGDDEAHQADDDYVRALEFGMPPTAGEGVGIDRLTMLLTGSSSIRDVILFPLMKPRT